MIMRAQLAAEKSGFQRFSRLVLPLLLGGLIETCLSALRLVNPLPMTIHGSVIHGLLGEGDE